MKLIELRRLLNALPLDADDRTVMFLDADTGDSYDLAGVEDAPDEEAVWIKGGLL
jgi:hypothetical protein